MTLDSSRDINLTKQLVTQHLEGQPVQIWLFGSQAWGGARRSSDIDVGILPLSPLDPGCLSDLEETLERSPVLPRVELFDLTSVDTSLRDKVMRQGIPWRI